MLPTSIRKALMVPLPCLILSLELGNKGALLPWLYSSILSLAKILSFTFKDNMQMKLLGLSSTPSTDLDYKNLFYWALLFVSCFLLALGPLMNSQLSKKKKSSTYLSNKNVKSAVIIIVLFSRKIQHMMAVWIRLVSAYVAGFTTKFCPLWIYILTLSFGRHKN